MLTDDPWMEADRREKEWDDECKAAPHCNHCGRSVYPHKTYLKIEGLIFCEPCVAYGTEYVDELEV